MTNPKTTWGGILLILAALATAVGHWFMGGLGMTDIQAIITAVMALVGGGALVAAKDGGA